MLKTSLLISTFAALLTTLSAGCSNPAPRTMIYEHRSQAEVLAHLERFQPTVKAGAKTLSFTEFVDAIADRKVVFVGEVHDRYDHHLSQLAVLRAMYRQDPRVAIGVEWFQQPFQAELDRYIAGEIDENTLLQRTEYYERWRYDYRMMRPILRFAREHRLPVLALNAERELTRKIGAGGLASLTTEERSKLPQTIPPTPPEYAAKLREVYAQHEGRDGDFENFLAVQRVWDATMAFNIERFMRQRPDHRVAVFAGVGHTSNEAGIPHDLKHYRTVPTATVTSTLPHPATAQAIDYLIQSEPASVPPAGILGVFLEQQAEHMVIKELPAGSAMQSAGARNGDLIVALDGQPISNLTDIKMSLLERKPGDGVSARLRRVQENGPPEEIEVRVKLQSAEH
ncbi:MAG: ChaN family lipoprotein [Thiotrichales bacterium]